MAYIYKITNDINNKVYVGKTERTIETRFKEHCKDAFKRKSEKRPLYAAMRKYGIEHFYVSMIEETDNPIEREIYWIGYYNGYTEGYNATLGGDGTTQYNHQEILKRLQEHPYLIDIAKEFNCSVDTVSLIAKDNNIITKNKGQCNFTNNKKAISAYSKNNEFIKSFESTVEAAQWCFENKKCCSLSSGVRSHIAEVANGKRKSAYGYIWKYNI